MSARNQRGSHPRWHGQSSRSCSGGGGRIRHEAAPALVRPALLRPVANRHGDFQPALSFRSARPYLGGMKKFLIDHDEERGARDHIGAIGDFWNYLKEDRPHKWTSMALAVTITGVVIYQIYASLIQPPPPRTIVYVESWPANRSQAEVEADWKERAIQANEDNAKRRAAYRSVADALGIDYEKAPGTEGGAPTETPTETKAPAKAQSGGIQSGGVQSGAVQPSPAPATPPADGKSSGLPVENPVKQGH